MRCHLVTSPEVDGKPLRKYVATSADVAETKRAWQEEHGFKRGQVTSEQVEVPTSKDGLLEYLNELIGA